MTQPSDNEIGQLRELQDRLAALRAEPPDPEGFAAALRERLEQERVAIAEETHPEPVAPAERRRSARWAWVGGLAAAAAAAVALGVSSLGVDDSAERSPLAISSTTRPAETATAPSPTVAAAPVPVDRVALITLRFDADRTLDDVDLEIVLPEGLVFHNADDQRRLEWRDDLEKGKQVVQVAVRGDRVGRFSVVAAASVAGERVEHVVTLDVQEKA